MKKSAKIISVVLSVAMVLSLVWAFAVNSLAADAPVFAVKEVSKKYNTVTVEVNLLSGSFNALDLNFSYSKGVKLKTIEQGSAFKTSGAMAMLNPNANTSADQSHASMVAIGGYNQKGQMLVATFQVPFASDYSISVYATDCRITVGDDNVEVKPTVKESVSYKYEKPTTSTTTKSTTTTTKPTTSAKPTNPTKTTAKSNNTPGTTIRTAVIPGSVTVTSGSGTTAQGDTTTASEPTDENLDIDEYSSESTEYSALSSEVNANAKAADKVQLKQSHNKKTIIIVAAAAAVLIAGAVVAIVLINKKKNNSVDTF